MLPSPLVSKTLFCWCLAVTAPALLLGQSSYAPQGGEYAIAGSLLGDQVHPQVSLKSSGGYLVWEDNITDGNGQGISALQLDSSFSEVFSSFRVNQIGAGDQERPQVALLNGGGAVFVWQGGLQGFQHIYARFLSPTNTWLSTNDVLVNTFTNSFQINPAVAVLTNGNVAVVWSSFNQQSSNSMFDVYAQLLTPAGVKIGGEFLVNQFTTYNQRTPSVAALGGGGFVVAWVSEQERLIANPATNIYYGASQAPVPSVDIYARLYAAGGSPVGSEFLVNTSFNVCANPNVAAASDGSFMVAWSQKDTLVPNNSWDVFARPFSSAGTGGTALRENTFLYGDQYAPQLAVIGADYLMTWTSLGQDGSMEGVYGQFLHSDGSPSGGEFRVNTTTISKQMHPAVAADGNGRFLAVWTGFTGVGYGFDLFAQRYVNTAQPLVAMNAPFVFAPFVLSNSVYQPQLKVSWPAQAGFSIDHYEVYVDGAATNAASVTTNIWVLAGIAKSSTHSFQVLYVTTDGRRSPLSPSASGTTWSGFSWGGLPFEWMAQYFGTDTSTWPGANSLLAPSGPTVLQAFLSGANPLDPSTWLQTSVAKESDGLYYLTWNPQAGLIYQVQMSTNLTSWANFGAPRFAAGTTDSVPIGGSNVGYYRVLLLR